MSKVSITKAAKLAGISRQQLYDGYIRRGKLTVDRTIPKRPKIDTSEIIRVFGILQGDNTEHDSTLHGFTAEKTTPYNPKLDETIKELTDRAKSLQAEKDVLEALAEERKDRIYMLQEQVNADRDERMRLLSIVEKQTRLLSPPQKKRKIGFLRWFNGSDNEGEAA